MADNDGFWLTALSKLSQNVLNFVTSPENFAMCNFGSFGFTPPMITLGVLLALDLPRSSLRDGVGDRLGLLVGLLRTEESSRFVSTVASSLLSDGELRSVRCRISSVISVIEHNISLDCKISDSISAISLTSNICSSSSANKVSLPSSCPRITPVPLVGNLFCV